MAARIISAKTNSSSSSQSRIPQQTAPNPFLCSSRASDTAIKTDYFSSLKSLFSVDVLHTISPILNAPAKSRGVQRADGCGLRVTSVQTVKVVDLKNPTVFSPIIRRFDIHESTGDTDRMPINHGFLFTCLDSYKSRTKIHLHRSKTSCRN